jgi:hypothetical protein
VSDYPFKIARRINGMTLNVTRWTGFRAEGPRQLSDLRADEFSVFACLLPLSVAIFKGSFRGMLIVARTVWLIAFCLLGLGPFALMKVVTGTSAPPVAADMADTTRPSVIAGSPEDILAKSDRLPVYHPNDAARAATVAAVISTVATQAPASDDPPKIVPRHWHEGNALPATKRKLSRRPPGKNRNTTVASNAHANSR